MTDSTVKLLVGLGLLVQVIAVGLGFTSLGWRWPLSVSTAFVALGVLTVQLVVERPNDPLGWGVAAFAVFALAAGAAHAFSPSPAAAWAAWVFFGIEALGQLVILLFLLLFRMNRLW